jgi:alcohol dehydrogenase (cytochrome c)
MKSLFGIGVAALASVLLWRPAGAAASNAPTFTVDQARAGQASYAQYCARCHGTHLDDGEFGPALRGHPFLDHWSGRPLADLLHLSQQSMPPDAPGSLAPQVYIGLTAYLLSQNGVAPANDPLPSNPAALSSMLLPGQAPEYERRAVGPSGGLAPGIRPPPWPAAASPLEKLTAVTDAMLQAPPEEDWISWRRSSNDGGFSPLVQITRQNVGSLKLAWSLALPAGPNEATPLVHDGVLFVHSYNDNVLALDAASGDELWRYARALPEGVSPVVQRNMALYGENLYFGTSDAHVVALNAKTGKLVWDQPVGDAKIWRVSGGPLVAQGKVMQGLVGRGAGGAYIVGLDAATGHETWRFHSIAQTGDAGEKTWNDTPLDARNGGSVWTAGSYDPQLKLAFFGPAQTYDTAPLQHPVKHRGVSNAGLYLDSTVALDPATGRLVWYYQHLPNDQWDYDWAFERQIVTLPLDGKPTKLVVTSGKLGIYDALEADSGRYAFSIDLGYQTLITKIDPKTGSKNIDPARYPGTERFTVCPHAGGGRSWLPGSYNPGTQTVFLPIVESCMDMIPVAQGERGSLSSGFRWTLRPLPNSDGKYGRIQAVNLATRQTLWTMRQRAPQSSGVLDTAGGVVFAGALDRRFSAYDDASGALLWETRLTDVPSSAPISYVAQGRQYVAMVVGFGGAQALTFPVLVPEIKLPPTRSSAIAVFTLP